jgi:hypothetical protein
MDNIKNFSYNFHRAICVSAHWDQWFAKNTDHCYELLKICNPLFCKLRVLDIFKCITFSFCVHTNTEFPTFQNKNPSYVKYLQKGWRVTRRCSKEQTNTGFLNAIFTPNARQSFFFISFWHLNMWVHLTFTYEMLNLIKPNQTTRSQM